MWYLQHNLFFYSTKKKITKITNTKIIYLLSPVVKICKNNNYNKEVIMLCLFFGKRGSVIHENRNVL